MLSVSRVNSPPKSNTILSPSSLRALTLLFWLSDPQPATPITADKLSGLIHTPIENEALPEGKPKAEAVM